MPFEEVTETLYTTAATAKGGREGHVTSEDGVVDLDMGKPGSKSNPKANPETLFAAGYAACFGGAINHLAAEEGIDTTESTVTANVTFGKTASGVGLAVDIKATLPGVDPAKAEELVRRAHEEVCPYSKATRDNIRVTVGTA
ncbi:Ohr family peroxiredoxin [Luteipulveratus sp. YIM 133132]|uniref:Ohr family peroxiredoxin n=1 Tax=Luteipulveratus flavus TaxID=3031728 RepID=UPI0023AF3E1C|nr:Ohr family peroxiredoxin [Luteipulveratus sp. YIM 133132]MDE9365300.1 Ohr family peroxiredoxin [Luteipulveratus sp. YIM 133132]